MSDIGRCIDELSLILTQSKLLHFYISTCGGLHGARNHEANYLRYLRWSFLSLQHNCNSTLYLLPFTDLGYSSY